jgi:hypothetical protein
MKVDAVTRPDLFSHIMIPMVSAKGRIKAHNTALSLRSMLESVNNFMNHMAQGLEEAKVPLPRLR